MNLVVLLGRLGKDPDTNETKSGELVCKFSIATSRPYKDKKTGEKREKTTWHNIVCWRKTAEIASKYLRKGSQVSLRGEIDNRSYEKDGVKKYISEVVVSHLELVGSKGDSDNTEKEKEYVVPTTNGNFVNDEIPF